MAKYQADVQALLEHIGGKENIQAVSHCMTRMRFVLLDDAKAGQSGNRKNPLRKRDVYPGRAIPGDHRQRCSVLL